MPLKVTRGKNAGSEITRYYAGSEFFSKSGCNGNVPVCDGEGIAMLFNLVNATMRTSFRMNTETQSNGFRV